MVAKNVKLTKQIKLLTDPPIYEQGFCQGSQRASDTNKFYDNIHVKIYIFH